jgi:hypothetical protein
MENFKNYERDLLKLGHDESKVLKIEGATCMIRRVSASSGGYLCGYVSAPEGLYMDNYTVHGGITFSGEIDGAYWYGFDCNAADDWSADGANIGKATYRDYDYVVAQLSRLVSQLQRKLKLEKGALFLDYKSCGEHSRLKTSDPYFRAGGLSSHIFEKDDWTLRDDVFKLNEGVNDFDLVLTLTYLNDNGKTWNEAYANLKTLPLTVEVAKDGKIFVSVPYFEGNLPKAPNWYDEWEINSWDSHKKEIEIAFNNGIWPDDYISEIVHERYKKAKIDLSYDAVMEYIKNDIFFWKDGKLAEFSMKYDTQDQKVQKEKEEK